MVFRLPPVNTLRLFEAAARLGSFKLAAEEVHITPSAVSHGIQTLEKWLGAQLFHRGPRGLSLTPAGQAYAPEVQAALSILAAATQRLPGRQATGTLAVSCAPTFAARWLMPRLGRFTEAHPDIRVSIDTSRRYVDFSADGVDLAIRMSSAPRSGDTWTLLVTESFVPVCAPQLRARGEDEHSLLSRLPLIHVTSVGQDWAAWFAARRTAPPEGARAIRVDTIQLAAEAAARGLGIALGRKPLVNDYLRDGDLTELAGPPVSLDSSYWLVTSPLGGDRPEIKAFRAWILGELRADTHGEPAARVPPHRSPLEAAE